MAKKERKSKRQLVRDEKRARKREREVHAHEEKEAEREAKRQRVDEIAGDAGELGDDYIPLDDGTGDLDLFGSGCKPEREFFGKLTDEEQEYFRHADELLELNDFPAPEERGIFLQNVYKEAEGKELKLASSQSCSRLMERLILLSNTRQKKHLFEAFAGHFMSLITHRFASHCCEKLFIQSAPVVTKELGGALDDEKEDEEEGEGEQAEQSKSSMEDLFLLTLDELEQDLTSLLSDRFASHTLRVLLIVLSGRPIDQVSTKWLLQSKKKEHITVQGASALADESNSQARAVPSTFTMAIKKIIADIAQAIDSTTLRVLAKHPTGNPVLQLLLELDTALNKEPKSKGKRKGEAAAGEEAEVRAESLWDKLLPGAPVSFSDQASPAADFVNTMMYDPIGSRLLEALITYGPGKIFKGLHHFFFAQRIQSLLRNDIASYPAIRVLNRVSKEDLVDAVSKCLPEIQTYVDKGRYNVIKTLFERCHARGASEEIEKLLKALSTACGGDWKVLVPKLCPLDAVPEEATEDTGTAEAGDDAKGGEGGGKADDKASEKKKVVKKPKGFQQDGKDKSTLLVHGSQLVSALLSIPGQPAKAIQTSLLALKPEQLLLMATASTPTAQILEKAYVTPAQNPNFHKILTAYLSPHVVTLANSPRGHHVLNSIITTPCKSEGISVPFHLKENIMTQLSKHEDELRESWMGRSSWRTWKGDMFSTRPVDWKYWVKNMGQGSS